MITIDQALGVLRAAKKAIGGDKVLALSLTDSGLEDVNVDSLVIVDERQEGGESACIRVEVRHPALVSNLTLVPEDNQTVPTYRNHYVCPECRHEWKDEHEGQPDDDCPICGKRHISPHKSVEGGVEFEYDMEYLGGNYDGNDSEYALVPQSILIAHGWDYQKAFQAHTKINPVHIIHYSEGELEFPDDDRE